MTIRLNRRVFWVGFYANPKTSNQMKEKKLVQTLQKSQNLNY